MFEPVQLGKTNKLERFAKQSFVRYFYLVMSPNQKVDPCQLERCYMYECKSTMLADKAPLGWIGHSL